MSDFEDSMAEAFAETLAEIGSTAFTIAGIPFTGDFDELSSDSYTVVSGGKELTVAAHLVAPRSQITALPAAGTRLKIGARVWVIATVSSDAVFVTLTLAHPDAH